MAVDMFLKIDGIPGESTDAKFDKELVLESFSWGETNTGAHTAGGGAGAGKVSMQDFHFTAKGSIATPKLMFACASGQHIKDAVMSVRRATEQKEGSLVFLTYSFQGVVITSVQEAGDTSGIPLDSVSFAFEKIDVMWKPQTASGAVGTPVEFAWNLKANQKI
jgi:type VI secretion system secreted protein Hcp